jgi:hypothetical protein
MNRTQMSIAVGTLVVVLGAAATAARAEGPIQQRKENQQRRIAQGVASGQLTAREAARLERGEASLNHEERAMRRANGGTLTPGDRAVIDHQQNRLSGGIYRLKHNAPHRP